MMAQRYLLSKRWHSSFILLYLKANTHPDLVLNVFFVRTLNAYLSSSSPTVTVNAVNPGYCDSELRRNLPPTRTSLINEELALPTEQGSRQLVYAAVAGKEENMRGGYVSFSEVVEVSDYVLSEEGDKVQERIWVRLHF